MYPAATIPVSVKEPSTYHARMPHTYFGPSELGNHLQKCTILKQARWDAEKPGNQTIGMGTTCIHHKRPSRKLHLVTTSKNKEITLDQWQN